MAASPRLGSSDSINDRDQSSSQPKRKWNGQQLNILSDGERRPEREGRDVIEAKSAEKAEIRGRQNSLRHVKNSTEVLRQRSTRRAVKDSAGMDGTSGAREGRQFMVANVGNNGRIYLRPSVRPPPHNTQSPPFVFPPTTPPNSAKLGPNAQQYYQDRWRDGEWSDTQKSGTQRARSAGRGAQSPNSSSRQPVGRGRTHSLSTADGPAAVQISRTGDYKIVIDHPNPASKMVSLPTIEVPIPHYRLGTPRFSARGTAFLHSSVYTRASTAEDARSSAISGAEYDRLWPVPPGMEPRSVLSRRHSHASPQPYSVRIAPMNEANNNAVVTSSPAFHRSKEPIVAAIFDALTMNPDDPAIVRYSPTTGEITAASPARIIAQITSKNFLDYELLSDFFLTVRSYLPTHDLLAYLLARFEWAVNRFDDDGRVIRVRAFAALRHWILNYFPYDFVIDRDLRVKFCERLNALSTTVRERSVHGPSDLKLILDLKKCWNGRCALYWDNLPIDSESRHDQDISPGGIAGSRDSQLTHPSQLWARAVDPPRSRIDSVVDPKESATALHNWFDAVIEAEDNRTKNHERQVSVITSRSLPTSPISEQSIPAMSCTLPGKGIRKIVTQSGRAAGVHPVPIPMTTRKVCPAAPSAAANDRPPAQPNHAHKRSGSFSDAFRDKRASLPSMRVEQPEEPVMMAFPYSGSLIRGSVLPPGSPYLDGFVLTTPISDLRSLSSHDDDSDCPENSKFTSPLSPGVKNLFGSIRRALSMRQVSGHPSSTTIGSGAAQSSKSSNLPLGVPHNREPLVEQRHLEALQKPSRIDLLCADAAEVYRRALMQPPEQDLRPISSIRIPPRHDDQQPPSEPQDMVYEYPSDVLVRNDSGVTYGSRSIVVINDTGDAHAPPVPAIPANEDIMAAEERSRAFKNDSGVKPLSTDPPPTAPDAQEPHQTGIIEAEPKELPNNTYATAVHEPRGDHRMRESSEVAADGERATSSHRPAPSTLSNGNSFKSSYSGSKSLRKYASYQSGINRSAPDHHFRVATSAGSVPRTSTETSDKPPGRMLRRRPGGDLRANQNVHELEMIPRPRSAGSITTYTDSLRASELYMNRTGKNSQKYSFPPASHTSPPGSVVPTSAKPLSLVRTHSSQPALRPSFEAAVAEFARIPDDGGGDIEATLLKLEGKYRKSPLLESSPAEPQDRTVEDQLAPAEPVGKEPKNPDLQVQSTAEESIGGSGLHGPQSLENLREDATPTGDRSPRHRYDMASSLYAESEESYDSTPLLERGLSPKASAKEKAESNESKVTVPRPLFTHGHSQIYYGPNLVSPLTEPGFDTDSQRRRRYRSSVPTTTDSFLLDEDEFLSDLSSEISLDTIDREGPMDGGFASSAELLQHDLQPPNTGHIGASSAHPPTPPMTKETAIAIASQTNRIQDQRKPPTPGPSPDNKYVEPAKGYIPEVPKVITPQPSTLPLQKYPAHRHLPFVLTYDAAVISEQFTIIEKDALNEINWQDLINMRWHHTSPSTLNWVDYLRTQEPTGIELVTARFNIMVKWVLSEIVLTQNVEERALCITKYIHIAKHSRKTHNYATLLQLTIALTSIDCSRLTKTWELVPAVEKKVLNELENLVTPIKNFNNLRQEMETANADEGCIPVVALYCHDLTYNSQKPSQIASTRDGEPLINFERYRTTATIVKSLLRLIDASAKYTFQPVEGVIEKCLWMASLSDDMIRLKSKELE